MCDVSSPKTSCVAEVCAQTVLHRAILRAGSPAQYLHTEHVCLVYFTPIQDELKNIFKALTIDYQANMPNSWRQDMQQ